MKDGYGRRVAGVLVWAAAVLIGLGLPSSTSAKAKKYDACEGGRFRVVEGAATIGAQATPGSEAVVIDGSSMAIESSDGGCQPAKASMKGKKDGTTRVRAAWRKGQCASFKGKATLKGEIVDQCQRIEAQLRVSKAKPRKRPLNALRARCGDGVVDRGEVCDGGNCALNCSGPLSVCGNGVVESGEACDGSDCNDTCTAHLGTPAKPFRDLQAVFTTSCALPSCHSALKREGGLVLESEGVSYQNLVDVPAENGKAKELGLMRVASGDPENSFIIRKLRGALDQGMGDRMPNVGISLPEELIKMVEDWIARGAHETAEECPAAATGNATTAAHGTGGTTICDDEPGPPIGDYVWTPEPPLEVPEKGKGIQLYAPPRPVESGTEWETCLAVRPDWRQIAADIGNPNGVFPAFIKKQEYRMHSGSHHLLLWAYNGNYPDQWPEGYFPCSATNCINPGDCPPDAGNTIPIGGTQVAGIRYEVNYPNGVGLPILKRDTVLIVNLHYTNPFLPAQEIYGEGWLNLSFSAPGEAKSLLDGIFAIGYADLVVEPYETKTMSSIWQPESVLNQIVGGEPFIDAAVFQIFGHMHKRGTLFQADYVKGGSCSASGILCGRDDDCRCKPWYKNGREGWQRNCVEGQTCVRGPDAEDTTIYHTTEWDNAPLMDFPKPYLLVDKDEGLRWTCTHTNGVQGDPTRPPKKCHEGCRSCGWDDTTRKCTFTRGVQLGVDDAPREFAEGEPIPLVFGELADDDMCNLFGYMIKQSDLPKLE